MSRSNIFGFVANISNWFCNFLAFHCAQHVSIKSMIFVSLLSLSFLSSTSVINANDHSLSFLNDFNVVRCFADQPRLLFNETCSDCHQPYWESSFIDYYKTLAMYNDTNRLPMLFSTCFNFSKKCHCSFPTFNAYCSMLNVQKMRNSILFVGDSMIARQLQTYEQQCPHAVGIIDSLPFRHFNPTLPDHFHSLQSKLKTNNHKIVYVGFALHFLALLPDAVEFPHSEQKVFEKYEHYIKRVIELIQTSKSVEKIVWLMTNSVCIQNWFGKFEVKFRIKNLFF